MADSSVMNALQVAGVNPKTGKDFSPKEAREAAESFEAVFLSQILNTMSAGIEVDGPFGGGQSEKMYRSMLNEEYAAAIARQGGIGIADQVYREILRLQDVDVPQPIPHG